MVNPSLRLKNRFENYPYVFLFPVVLLLIHIISNASLLFVDNMSQWAQLGHILGSCPKPWTTTYLVTIVLAYSTFEFALLLALRKLFAFLREKREPIVYSGSFILVGCVATVCSLVGLSWVQFAYRQDFLRYSDFQLLPTIFDKATFQELSQQGIFNDSKLYPILFIPSYLLFWCLSQPFRHQGKISFGVACVSLMAVLLSAQYLRESPTACPIPQTAGLVSESLLRLAPVPAFLASLFSSSNFTERSPVELDLSLRNPNELVTNLSTIGGAGKTVVVVVVEALRADALAASENNQEVMPWLKSFAAKNTSYPRSFAAANETVYSQMAIMTGIYPLRKPYRTLDFVDGNTRAQTIGPMLRAHDIKSAFFGFTLRKIGEQLKDEVDFFHAPFEGEESGTLKDSDEQNLLSMKSWLSSQSPEKPAFVFFYVYRSHFPYDLPSGVKNVFPSKPVPAFLNLIRWPESYTTQVLSNYRNALGSTDQLLHRLYEAVGEIRDKANTLFIFTGDHGELFHEHGEAVGHGTELYEEVVRVPIILAGANLNLPLINAAVASHVDIAPTVVDYFGLVPDGRFQGQSLLKPLLPNRPVFVLSQSFEHEDSIVCWPEMFTTSKNSLKSRLEIMHENGISLTSNDLRSDSQSVLASSLQEYKDAQLSYFTSLSRDERSKFNPPQSAALPCPIAYPTIAN